MEPVAKWGPRLWRSLEQAAANYPENPSIGRKQEAKYMLIGLPSLLPCNSCSSHLRQQLLTMSISGAIKNRENMFRFVWLLHESVNKRLGKRGISLASMKRRYNI